MSYRHYTIVGHFDPESLFPDKPLHAIRALERLPIDALLHDLPREVQESVDFRDGYMVVHWAPMTFTNSEKAYEFAYRVAAEQQCIALESNAYLVTFPKSANEAQQYAWKNRIADEPQKKGTSSAVAYVSLFNPPAPAPCPYCGNALRTAASKQCRHCKMDWHDPANAYCRVAGSPPAVSD